MIRADAKLFQAGWQLQSFNQRGEPGHQRVRFTLVIQRGICIRQQIVSLREFVYRGRSYKGHAGCQQDGVGDAVRQMIFAAQRIGHGVNQMRARMGDRRAAVIRGPQHIEPRLQVVRLGNGSFEAGEQLLQADQRVIVAYRIGHRGGKAFNQMTKRIDAGGRGDMRRHAGGQLRHQRHEVGQHHRRDNADFGFTFGNSEDRIGRRFRAGAGGSGDQQRGGARGRLFARQQRLQRRGVIDAQHRKQLGDIEHAAAADANNQIHIARGQRRQHRGDVMLTRFRRHAVNHADASNMLFQLGDKRLHRRDGFNILVRHQQRAGFSFQQIANVVQRLKAANYRAVDIHFIPLLLRSLSE